MYDEKSNIDDLLSGAPTKMQPETPESANDYDNSEEQQDEDSSTNSLDSSFSESDNSESEEVEEQQIAETDDYGNAREAAKVYTEEEVKERINKAVRDRLARIEKNERPQQPNTQQQDINFDNDAGGNWEQQLENFVENAVTKMATKNQRESEAARERQAHIEFESKFHDGMGKFNDFVDVVGSQPVTDAMTLSLRAVKDPAAFIYAAAKRNPSELQRISQINDPYTQMVEMGRLEERMRKSPNGTMAPKPVGKTSGDSVTHTKQKKESSIEDLIQSSEKRKMAKIKQFRSGK